MKLDENKVAKYKHLVRVIQELEDTMDRLRCSPSEETPRFLSSWNAKCRAMHERDVLRFELHDELDKALVQQ